MTAGKLIRVGLARNVSPRNHAKEQALFSGVSSCQPFYRKHVVVYLERKYFFVCDCCNLIILIEIEVQHMFPCRELDIGPC